MPTFKICAKEIKADKTRHVYIRCTHNRKTFYIKTPYYINDDEMTAKKVIKNERVVKQCQVMIKHYMDRCVDLGEKIDKMDVKQVVNYIATMKDIEQRGNSFIGFAQTFVDNLRKSGHDGNAHTYDVAVKSFCKFVGGDIDAEDLTTALLQKWVKHLAETTKGRAPSLYFGQLRAIYKKMQFELNDEERDIVPLPRNPFLKVEVPKPAPTRKKALTIEQIRQIVTFKSRKNKFKREDENDIVSFARDMFVLSFLLIGMNEADIYELQKITDGRIVYQRKKTRNRRADNAEMSVLVTPECQRYIDFYKDETEQRVFRFYKMYSTINGFSAAINKGLKIIGNEIGVEGLTFYAARHSWATIAVNECGVNKYVVHQALNHVDDKTAITDIYIKKDWRLVDEANRMVIELISRV